MTVQITPTYGGGGFALDPFFNPVMQARGGVRLAILVRNPDPNYAKSVEDRIAAEGRSDLVPGVAEFFAWVAAQTAGDFHAEKLHWTNAVKYLIVPEVVSLMTDAWRKGFAGALAYYFPPHI